MVLIKVLTFNVASDGKIKKNKEEMQNVFKQYIDVKITGITSEFILLISFQEDSSKPILISEEFINTLKDKEYNIKVFSKGIFNYHIHNIIITKLDISNIIKKVKI